MSEFITNSVVKIHHIVQLTILETYSRLLHSRAVQKRRKKAKKSNASDIIIGTLLGYYQNGELQVTNCFAIPVTETHNSLNIDVAFNEKMIANLEKSFPREHPVGWFTTVKELSLNIMLFHDYFSGVTAKALAKKNYNLPTVLVTMAPSLSAEGDKYFSVCCYARIFGDIQGPPSNSNCVTFKGLRVELDTFLGEKVALAALQSASEDPKGKAKTGMERIKKDVKGIGNQLKKTLTYVDEIIANETVKNNLEKGGQLDTMVNHLSAILSPEKHTAFFETTSAEYNLIDKLATMVQNHMSLTEKLIQNGI